MSLQDYLQEPGHQDGGAHNSYTTVLHSKALPVVWARALNPNTARPLTYELDTLPAPFLSSPWDSAPQGLKTI